MNLNQDYDVFEILSLKLTQQNAYKLYQSNYGVIVGRVMANGGFGVPNAKVSVFIKVSDADYLDNEKSYLYPYLTVRDSNNDNVRYNLLPARKVDECHQNVGTFPTKRMVLDDDIELEIFEDYWKFTTATNQSGDYMLFGIPMGTQQLHVDVDLSDIGILSQRPYDMIYKGYDINQFESPNQFKKSTNLDSLSQLYSQDKGVYVYPFWGDAEGNEQDREIAVTRCDVQLQYQFEPTCVFMGSVITDTSQNAIGKNCVSQERLGSMADMVTGEGSIEMIRKTIDNQVEEFQIKGTRLIDGDGVWCYQIPMNLDYVTTDEYGNMVQTDDPTKGIPTRTRVRFRITMDDSPNDSTNRKRCKYLVPNNPAVEQTPYSENDPEELQEKMTEFDKLLTPDYEFGTNTREDSFRDLFWNKVYTVKSYIPRLQKDSKTEQRKFTGVKLINHFGSNNPMPFNNAHLKLTLLFRFMCVLIKIFIKLVSFLNTIISIIGWLPCNVCELLRDKLGKIPLIGSAFKLLATPFCTVADPLKCIGIDRGFCDDGINNFTYYPGCLGKPFACVWNNTQEAFNEDETERLEEEGLDDPLDRTQPTNQDTDFLITCIENNLAQQNEVTSFDFYNDWVNGVLYMPLWYRYIRKKKKFFFGLFTRKAKDEWCSAEQTFSGLKIFQPCALIYDKSGPSQNTQSYVTNSGEEVDAYYVVNNDDYNSSRCFAKKDKSKKCYNQYASLNSSKGLIVTKQTMLDQTVYYYKPMDYLPAVQGDKGVVITLFATDIVLLGSLSECDLDGTPQFFKYLESTTYNMPNDILFTDLDAVQQEDGTLSTKVKVEQTGADWGNYSSEEQCGSKDDKMDGGLFYGIGCSHIEMMAKSCVNMSRMCELGVNLDTTTHVQNLETNAEPTDDDRLVADGFISKDELSELDARSMFATMNGNNLKTYRNETNGLFNYDFRYLYPENFDGSMYQYMQERQRICTKSYRYNYLLEQFNLDYYKFRFGMQKRPTYYNYYHDGDDTIYYYYDDQSELAGFPRYENSFYFYFGLHSGSTAIEKFYSQFFADCRTADEEAFQVSIRTTPNAWCDIDTGELVGGITLTFGEMVTPFSIIVHNETTQGVEDRYYTGITDEVVYLGYALDENPRDIDGLDPLPNATYTLTITDGEGNVVQKEVELASEYLTFAVEGVMGMTDNKTLIDTYNNDCDRIRREKKGGHIVVSFISVDNVLMCSEFADCGENERIYRIKLYEITEETDANGNTTTKETEIQLTEEECTTGILQICLGDRNYRVEVIELCDGVESANKVSQTVYVSEPGRFQLLINGVDYDIIKRFHTGYDSPDKQNTGAFCGWDKISQITNPYYDWPSSVTDLETDLRGTLNPKTGELYTEVEIMQEIYDAKQEIITQVKNAFWMTCTDSTAEISLTVMYGTQPILYQQDYYDEIRVEDENEEDGYRLDYQRTGVQNTQYVFDVETPTLLSSVNEDAESGTLVGNYGYLHPKKHPYFVAAFSNYSEDPTTINAKRPVDAEPNNSDTFFGVHLIDKFFELDIIAWAWVKDLHIWKVFKPEKTNVDYGDGSDLMFNDLTDVYFDQTGGTEVRRAVSSNATEIEVTCDADWLTINEGALVGGSEDITLIAGENPNDEERRTTVTIRAASTGNTGGGTGGDGSNVYNAGNYGGWLMGNIYNGITQREQDESGNEINAFQEITCGNVIPEYQNDTPMEYEDALPTIRKILGPSYTDSIFPCLNEEGRMKIPYANTSFDITDYGSCGLSVNIYGSARISIVEAYGDKVNDVNTLYVNVTNGPGECQYVLLDATDGVFPFPMFDPCEGAIYQPEVTNEQILERGMVQVWDDGMNNEGQGSGEQEHRYTTDGRFTFNGEKAVYVVMLDENGNRQLSEVYDFSKVTAIVGVTTHVENYMTLGSTTMTGETVNPDTGEVEVGETQSPSSGTTGVPKYGLTLKLSTDHWYISQYTSEVSLVFGQDGGNAVTFSGTLKGKAVETDRSPLEQICIVEINEGVYDAICAILETALLNERILNQVCMVEVTDCLGVTIRCEVKAGKCD